MKRKSIGVALALAAMVGVGITYNQAQAAGIKVGATRQQAQTGETSHKVKLCHGTASRTNPYVLIEVDQNALKGHFDGTAPGHGKNNHPDFISNDGSCGSPPDNGDGAS
jgi:hypothetical protein